MRPRRGPGWFKVTVQVVLPLDASADAVHCSEEISAGGSKEMVALPEEPLTEAVTVAL